MKQKIKYSILLLLCSSFISCIPVAANDSSLSTYSTTIYLHNGTQITPYSDTFEWRYKMINGKLYKRLYNTTKDRWETDWILVS